MARGFTDEHGRFRPTGNNTRTSSREKTIGTIEGMTIEEQRIAEVEISKQLKKAIFDMKPVFQVTNPKTMLFEIERTEKEIISDRTFEDKAEENAYRIGFDRGLFFANGALESLNGTEKDAKLDPDYEFMGDDLDTIANKFDLLQVAEQVALEAEENDHQMSPFEITAKEIDDSMFNEEGEQINEALDEFREGVANGINWMITHTEVEVELK